MLFWLSCTMAGLSFYCVAYVLMSPLRQSPADELTATKSCLSRLFWPWVLACAVVAKPFLSWHQRLLLRRRLQTAGLQDHFQAEHIAGLQLFLLSAVLIVGALLWQLLALNLPWLILLFPAGLAFWWPRVWLASCCRQRQQKMLKEFPFMLDMTTLCIEAGLNLQGALLQAARHGPDGPLRQELRHALSDMRAGMARQMALEAMAKRTALPAVEQLVLALGHAEQLGMNLGPLMRAQSMQRRNERFLRAEKLALEAPVKMLFPLVFCFFPCTFLIIGFPIAVKLFEAAL